MQKMTVYHIRNVMEQIDRGIYIYIKEINYFIDILGDSEYIAAEIKWEVMCAVTDKQAYDKWGKHNLPSLACAHENQTCNNFKDQGMILKNIKQ